MRRFQEDFARALLASDDAGSATSSVGELVRQPGFAVYRNTVLKGCIDALQANYPAVARLVGDEYFRAAAAEFARTNLPRAPMLMLYGEGFADFLAAFEPARELPYLPGVARLDRFWTEAHVAPDATPLEADVLARLDAMQLQAQTLRPHPSARWAYFESAPIYTIWQRNRAPGPIDENEIDWRGEGALLVRPRDEVRWIGLDAAGCAFLDACATGGSLGEASAAALDVNPQADLADLGKRLFAAGAFADVA